MAPLNPSGQEPGSEPRHEPRSDPASPAKILLVDDNADMRDYVKRLLSQQYEVEAVSDGLIALEAVRQHLPDLVLTDVMMPNLDGFGLLQALRSDSQTREVPVIMLSARAGEEARIEGLSAGADDYLIKPFSARELLARVEATLKLAQLRREAGAVIRESEEKYRLLFESIDQGFCIVEVAFDAAPADRSNDSRPNDSRSDHSLSGFRATDYRFLLTNPAFAQQTGMQNVQGKTIREIAPKNEDYWFEIYSKVALTGEAIRFENYAGAFHRWYEVHAFRVGESHLRQVGILFNDISDRKQAELEREQLLQAEQQAREEAQVANRIKDEFLAVLSHELRSPLNPILGWAKLLQSGSLDAVKTAQALATIERNAKLQSELIEDLLDVSRILQGKLSLTVSSVNLASTIRAAIETVQLAAQAKSITLETRFDPQVGQISGDATRLQQIVWNLLSNAVKFTPDRGQVTIQLHQVGDVAQITVSDTGKGIEPGFLPYVFDYFRQEDGKTTRKFGGLGLGLAIVRHLVELHGGTIAAASAGEGQGATFTVKLPAPQIRLSENTPESPNLLLDTTNAPLFGIRILVVDDEADMRHLAAFLLEQAGATVLTTATAAIALEQLAQFQPDILLSDIGMPDLDGYMLMQQIRTLPPGQGGQVPAIALTAYAGEWDQQQARQAGFQRHLAKPIEPDALIKAIVQLWQDSQP